MPSPQRYPLVSSRNLPAYAAVLAAWAGVSILLALALRAAAEGALGFGSALALSAAGVGAGMAIMFGASAVNLRKLGPGFARLADGEADPAIPPVWCPVLTMATRSAVELAEKIKVAKSAAAGGDARS